MKRKKNAKNIGVWGWHRKPTKEMLNTRGREKAGHEQKFTERIAT